MIMTKALWLSSLLPLVVSTALGANHAVGIGDDCPPTEIWGCFFPTPLVINVGDSVTFSVYAELVPNGPHNVVADDGSFSSGPPGDYHTQWKFTQTFNVPGVVRYHDEATQASGVVIVQDASHFTVGP